MRVISQDEYGGPEVLHLSERPTPEPLPTEVRVRVVAAGVNPVDWKTRTGRGMAGVIGPPPFVLGWDVAGVVDATGYGVTRFAPGDRVFGMPWFPRQAGAYGELVTAPSRQFARVPTGVDDLSAGALPLAALTAWHALEAGNVEAGQRVLVLAAAGGVGHLAVQLARARGATVIGTASREKHDLLARLGVDEAIDYRSTDLSRAVRGVDAVIDLVGGPGALDLLSSLRPGGTLVVVPSGLPDRLAGAARDAGVHATGMLVEPDGCTLESIADLVAAGTVQVVIAGTFPLEEVAAAHRAGESGRTTGKLVLTV
jgi:NADPH:quinone reductase-like Zn-dependent oxidoreductase